MGVGIQKTHPVLKDSDIEAVVRFLKSGKPLSGFRGTIEGHSGGENVQILEQNFKDYFGVRYAIAFNSATSALHAACIARDTMDAVVSPYSFVSSASCVSMAGGYTYFADIQSRTFCIDPYVVADIVATNPIDTIIPVHLCGHPADMDKIMQIARRRNIKVIEDCAQAIGATYKGKLVGTIGDCGIFSFNQSKTVSCGEGGMLITNDDYIANIARAVRNHGEVSDPDRELLGYNYRMNEIEAILALEQFKRLDAMNYHRIKLCNHMTEGLSVIKGFTPPVVEPGCKHVYYTYACKYSGNRDKLQQRLLENGVYFGSGYVKPLYLLPYFGGKLGQCPVAERMWQKELMVTDIFRDNMTIEDCDKILAIIEKCNDA